MTSTKTSYFIRVQRHSFHKHYTSFFTVKGYNMNNHDDVLREIKQRFPEPDFKVEGIKLTQTYTEEQTK